MHILLIAGAVALALAQPPDARLTPDGLGPVRIGMSRAEVTRIVGPLEGEEITQGCIEMEAARGWANTWFMFEDERLTRISIGEGSRTRTPRDIGIGSTEAEVRRAYGRGLQGLTNIRGRRPATSRSGRAGRRAESASKPTRRAGCGPSTPAAPPSNM